MRWNPDALRSVRNELGWSQVKAAEKIGVHHITLHRWEKGKSVPDGEDISAICNAYNIESKILLSDE